MLSKRVRIIILAPILFAVTAWATLVVLFTGPDGAAWTRPGLASACALASVAALLWLRPFWKALAVWGTAMAMVLFWWGTLRPSNESDWQPDVVKLSWAEVHGDVLTFHNVRNFNYHSETDFAPRYEDRVYDLSKLRGYDLFLSYWGSPAIAHTIMSWDFEDSLPLAISIETRKKKGQQYSAVKGFFRQYEIIYVAADERDVVRLRTNYRDEQVYLYQLKVSPERAKALLLDYVATMNTLVETPEFYNALVDNCTTSISRHVRNIAPETSFIDWRLLANGYGDEMLYEHGTLDTRLPFAELKARSLINVQAKALDQDPAFSHLIREALPDPRSSATPGTSR
jgi:hypothetical protein